MSPNNLQNLLTFQNSRTRNDSSYGKDPFRGGDWGGFRPPEALIKRVMIKPGETHRMASLSGPGLITRIWSTTLLPFNAHAFKDLTLRFYWDGEIKPSVAVPFGDFFGAPFGRYKHYLSEPLCLVGGAYLSFWPMPFQNAARLEVTNEGQKAVEPFFYNVTYQVFNEEPPSSLRFHAQWRRENPTTPGVPYTILDATGNGHFVGCHINMQNKEWWLRPPLKDIPFPLGFGMGMLEGWESITIDGEAKPSIVGTGTEDFFLGAWYYSLDGEFNAPHHGCLVRDYLRGRIAAYRFDIPYPLPFSTSIQVKLDHGFRNQVQGDYSSTAYWYQEEPHAPYPSLPDPEGRRVEGPWNNLAQAALLAGPPAVAALTLVWRLSKRLGDRA